MENYNQLKKQTKKDTIFKKVVDSYFAIMLQLLKNKSIDQLWACVLIFIMFSQVFAGLFEREIFLWKDDMLLEPFQSFCDYIRIVEAINTSKSAAYYWIVFYFAISYLFIITLLLAYLHYSLNHPKFYFESIVQALRYLLIISYSVLFLPFYEIFISIFRCDENNNHYLVKSMECYSTNHAIASFVAVIGLLELILLNIVIALLYNETQPVKEDSLSRLDSNFEILMLFYRMLIGTLSQYCLSSFCSWIIIAVCLISSMYFQYQYYKYLPYYNSFVSIFFGCMIGIYFWISVNALLSEFFEISGHIVVILIGIPIVCQLVKSMRENRIETLMTQTTEQMKSDIDSLNQIILLQDWLRESSGGSESTDIDKEMKVKGLITLHISDCEDENCICKNVDDLYDHSNDKYLQAKNITDLHSNQVFVNHFNKQLYTWALNKFINSPSIHISYAFYQFSVMKNIHAALHELKVASKKRPTIQQQFTIFRYQNIIETYIKKESEKMKHIYEQLTNVKEFEKLFQDMQKQIEKVCNFQVEFWTHLTTVIPDLNHLNDLNNKIYDSSKEADRLWSQLCEINPHYPQALTLYGEYLTFIRNNQQAGKEYFDQAHNVDFAQKSVQDHIKRSEILFSEDSTVVHISGNRESSGRILKVSQGLFKCFGFSKQEVIGHNVNTLMPTLFADKHNDFLDIYYRTGRANIFNRERQLFASNRSGYCFTMKILIKQMPSLKEDVQYVGMVKPISTDYEYILTDMSGNIDSFTSGIGSMLSLNPQLFKDQLSINIQILAPELISIFEYKRAGFNGLKNDNQNNSSALDPTNYRNYYRRPSFNTFQYGGSKFLSNNKYSVPGGDQLNFIIPNNFANIIKSEKPAKSNRNQGKKGGKDDSSMQHHTGGINQAQPNKFLKSAPFREFLKYLSKGKTYVKKAPDIQKLLICKEYRECDIKKNVNIEIREWGIPLGNNEQKGLKLLLFMINKNQQEKRGGQDLQSFDGPQQQNNQTANMNNNMYGPGGINQQNTLNQYTGAFGQSLQKEQQNNNDFQSQGTLVQRSIQNITNNSKYQIKPSLNSSNNQQHQQSNSNSIPDLPPPIKKNVNNQGAFGNPLGSAFQSAGLSGRIQNHQILRQQMPPPGQQPQLQQAISFLEIDQHPSQEPLTPVREETVNPDTEQSPLKIKKYSQAQGQKTSSYPATSKKYDILDDGKLKLLSSDRVGGNKSPNALDLNDLQFERQETDEQEEDNEHEIDTDRIDVKKEIVLNDEIKQNTKSFEENQYQKSESKLSLKLESKSLLGQQQSQDINNLRVNNGNANGAVNQIQNHIGAVNNNASAYNLNQNSRSMVSEEQKNQVMNKPLMERISQSKDDDDGADDEGYDDDEFDEDSEDMDDAEDDEYDDGDDDQLDENYEGYDGQIASRAGRGGKRSRQKSNGDNFSNNSQGNSDEELMPNQETNRGRMNDRRNNNNNNGGGGSAYSSGQNSKNLNSNQSNQQQMMINSNQQQLQQQEKKQKYHDYTRIVTNPRYKAFDDETCGSAYFNECNCSERELDIRDVIKKNQATKKRREKRRNKKKEEEEKKQITIANGEELASTAAGDKASVDVTISDKDEVVDKSAEKGRARVKKMRGANRRKESNSGSESKSKSRSRGGKSESGSEDQKEQTVDDDENVDEYSEDERRRLPERDQDQMNDEGEVSSIASSQQSQARTFFSLRAAIDEKFIPMQIKNLRYVANIVWFTILLLAIVYYVIQLTLFSDIQDYIGIIINSEKRINDIMNMNLKLNNMMLINEGILTQNNYLFPDKNLFIQTLASEFLNSTTELKNSQTLLSLQTSQLSENSRRRINPEDVILQFETIKDLPSTYSYSIWEAIMQIVVHAYKLAETPLEIVHSNPDVQFITNNCMNSVMNALQESTNAIISESDNARETNINVFMYLLISVSCALMLSMGFLMPVIKKAKFNKQEVFELFTHRKIEKCIDEQLKKCRWFIAKYQSQAESQNFENELQDNMIEENTHIPEKEMKADDDKQSEYMKNYKKQKKKWKQINISFGSLMLKFSFVLLAIEGFFMFNYFISKQFLGQVQLLTKELRLLISRQPSNSYILLLEKELIYSNNSVQFLFQDVNTVLTNQFANQYSETQDLLTQFSQNYDFHSTRYNEDFNSIIYGDVCEALQFRTLFSTYTGNFSLNATIEELPITRAQCQAFNGGILQKGVYNSVVKFWTQLQQLYNDFYGSNRTKTDIQNMLNHQKLILSERMSEQYFEDSHWHLVQVLKNDIDQFFTTEFSMYQVVFIFFIMYILIIYFLIWRIFIKHLVEELWKAKAVLSVLPVDICFRIEEIRTFIYQNSSTFTGANS